MTDEWSRKSIGLVAKLSPGQMEETVLSDDPKSPHLKSFYYGSNSWMFLTSQVK